MKQNKTQSCPEGSAFCITTNNSIFLLTIKTDWTAAQSETQNKVCLRLWAARIACRLLGLCSKVRHQGCEWAGCCGDGSGRLHTGRSSYNRRPRRYWNSKLNVMKWFPCWFLLARRTKKRRKKYSWPKIPLIAITLGKGRHFYFFFWLLISGQLRI